MVIVHRLLMRILRNRFEVSGGEALHQAEQVRIFGFRHDISETIKLKHLFVLKDPSHDLSIERHLIGAWIK
jgi:hypothetical protein